VSRSLLLCLDAICLSLVAACEAPHRQYHPIFGTHAYRPHESFWRRRVWFSVKGSATLSPPELKAVAQFVNQTSFPRECHNKRNTSTPWAATGRSRQRLVISFPFVDHYSRLHHISSKPPCSTTECKKLNPSLPLALGLNAQTPATFSARGTFPPGFTALKATQLAIWVRSINLNLGQGPMWNGPTCASSEVMDGICECQISHRKSNT
jgi:hypothetical protein